MLLFFCISLFFVINYMTLFDFILFMFISVMIFHVTWEKSTTLHCLLSLFGRKHSNRFVNTIRFIDQGIFFCTAFEYYCFFLSGMSITCFVIRLSTLIS